jgi:anti-anti-sigma factor
VTLPHLPFAVTVEAGPRAAHLRICGDLDDDSAEVLVDRAARCVSTRPDLRDLHLDCAQLRFCDSSGLSALLMVHRTADAAGVDLHLDHVPPLLERLLTLTGVRGLFGTGGKDAAQQPDR